MDERSWTPGSPGKGAVLNDDTILTWNYSGDIDDAQHWDMLESMGLNYTDSRFNFYIDTDGTVNSMEGEVGEFTKELLEREGFNVSDLSVHDWDWTAKVAWVDNEDWGGTSREIPEVQVVHGQQPGTRDMPHQPLIYDGHGKRIFVGQPGTVHADLQTEFPELGEHENWQDNLWREYGVLTPNGISWYGSFPHEDGHGYDYKEHAIGISNALGVGRLEGDTPGVCSQCGGSGADYDASGGYYHDAQGRCKMCGGTGRAAVDGWTASVRVSNVLNWDDGQYGRGGITQDGTVHTFDSDEYYNHAEYEHRHRLKFVCYFGIQPDGQALCADARPFEQWEIDVIEDADPRLHVTPDTEMRWQG